MERKEMIRVFAESVRPKHTLKTPQKHTYKGLQRFLHLDKFGHEPLNCLIISTHFRQFLDIACPNIRTQCVQMGGCKVAENKGLTKPVSKFVQPLKPRKALSSKPLKQFWTQKSPDMQKKRKARFFEK
jgi:hypothetical protein